MRLFQRWSLLPGDLLQHFFFEFFLAKNPAGPEWPGIALFLPGALFEVFGDPQAARGVFGM